MKENSPSMEIAHNRLLINNIQKKIEKTLDSFVGFTESKSTLKNIDENIKDVLSENSDKGLIKPSFSCDTSLHKVTWKEIYPNFIKRNIARLIIWILRVRSKSLSVHEKDIKWYHYLLPYFHSVSVHIKDLEIDEDDECELFSEDLLQYIVEKTYAKRHCSLKVPHNVVNTDVSFSPIKSVESIEINTIITNS